uniref:Uncharacterized protein n=1 Tax=Avena sativa TaxID=4498 RepID=A0ACD5X4T3_AVESA
MSNGEQTAFTMMIHVLRKANTNHAPVGGPVHVHVKEEQSDASGRSDGSQSGHSGHSRSVRKTAAISSSADESGEDSASECDSFESDDVRTPPEHDYVLLLRSYLDEAQKEKVVMLLQDIQPKTTVFVAIMKKSNVEPPYASLQIPRKYAVIHFPHENASVTLERPGESKKWHPRFYKRASGHRIRGQQWFDFVCDNHVEEGDICPFVPPYILPQNSCLSPLQQIIVEDKMQTIQLEAPLYVAIMKNSSVGVNGHYVLEFGAQYADTYLPKREEPILLQHKGKIWHTKLRIWSRCMRRVLDCGWRKFVRDNRLQVGDTCLFELKNYRKKLTMTVHIIPSDQC